jgi:hypothetical protein
LSLSARNRVWWWRVRLAHPWTTRDRVVCFTDAAAAIEKTVLNLEDLDDTGQLTPLLARTFESPLN